MGKSTPAAPDPAAGIAAQGVANLEAAETQARLNRIDEFTPLGSTVFGNTFDQEGFDAANQRFNDAQQIGGIGGKGGTDGTGVGAIPNIAGQIVGFPDTGEAPDRTDFERFTRTTTLNPTAQATFDAQQNLGLDLSNLARTQTGRVEGALGQTSDFSGLPGLDPSLEGRQRQEEALFDRQAGRLNQRFGDEQEALDVRLANQGIQAGSDTFNRAQESFGRTRNDAFENAALSAIVGGGQEQSRLFGLSQGARQQGITEQLTQRNQPINDISALLSNSQVQIPNFGGIAQVGVAAPDVLGFQQQALNQQNLASQSRQQFGNNLFNLGGGLGSAGILASDRRLKKNIHKIGKLMNGLNVYTFDYIWGEPSVGVMADEVKEIMPHAVINIGGFDHVNYSEII